MDLALDNNHDLFVTNQDLTLTTVENKVIQDLLIRLQFILNEWFLDNSVGVPYPQTIFEKGTNLSVIYSIFRNEIKGTDDVKKLNKLILTPTPSSKSLLVNFEVIQNNGTIINQTINLGL